MPTPILRPNEGDTEGTVIERLLGRDANKRQTKTWIPRTTLINRLAILRNHSGRLLSTFRALHLAKLKAAHIQAARGRCIIKDPNTQCCVCPEAAVLQASPWAAPKVSDDDLRATYSSIATYEGFHQQIVEHLGSYKGFLVNAAFGRRDEADPNVKPDSSAGVEQRGKQQAQPQATPQPTQPSNGMAMK